MKSFRRVAFLTTLATYFLIFTGSLVRVSGAGLGCPDWPRCYGRWIPPLQVADLPSDIHPTGLTVILAWIEYTNRFIGVLVGLLIFATAVLALRYYRKMPRILVPSLLALLLVAYVGWQGGKVVTSELAPILVSIHLLLSYVIVSLLIYVTQQTYYFERGAAGAADAGYPSRSVWWVGLLWVGGLLQILLGTQVREELEIIGKAFPLLTDLQWIAKVGLWNDIHMISGLLMAVFTWFVGFSILRMSERPSALVQQSLWGVMILMMAQIVIGLLFYLIGLPPVMTIFHQWIAGLFIGLTLVLYFGVRHRGAEAARYGRSFQRLVAPIGAAVLVLFLIAYLVISRAEAERHNLPVLGEVPQFTFTERHGEPFGLDQMKGKVNVVDFFFATCPGPCPIMNATMADLYREYAHSDKVQFVSLTTDPDRDTLPALQEYATRFGATDHRWVFLRGDTAPLSRLAEEGFHLSGEFPGMHSLKFVLVDSQGRIRGYYDYDSESSLKRLRQDIAVLARDAA